MDTLVHFCGVVVKYIFLNTKALFKIVFQKKKLSVADFSEIDTIIFTHNLGGGTARYERQNFCKKNMLLIRVISYRNDFAFSLENVKFKKSVSATVMFSCLKYLQPKTVIVNSLCGYAKPEKILNFIIDTFSNSDNKYLVHDYHCICDKNNATLLLNKQYCELKCLGCKLEKKAKQWRVVWLGYFSIVTEVICFSDSSKDILLTVYQELLNKISVVPHSMAYCNFIPLNSCGGRNFAVIGNCSNVPKGKNVIRGLVREVNKIRDRKLYIIGKAPFLFHRNSQFVKYTGKYDLKFLPEILQSGKIGVIVFTSILPETFSYAVSEFMMLGLYIVSLNLGAQGEKLKNYQKTVFVKDLKPETILAGVEKCFTS